MPSKVAPSGRLPEESTGVRASLAALAKRPGPEGAAVDVRNAVMPRQPFVDEGVVRPQQIKDTVVFLDDALEEQLRFAPEGLPQVVVEVGEHPRVRALGGQV